jgi:transposase
VGWQRVYLLPPMKGKSSKQPAVPDFSGLRVELKRLSEAGAHDSLVELVLGLLEKMAAENTRLAFRLQAALRQAWRKKSERLSSEQLALFLSEVVSQESTQGEGSSGEGQPPSPPPPKENSALEAPASAVAVEEKENPAKPQPGNSPKRSRKRPFPDTLRREIKFIPVAQDERAYGQCGAAKEAMGYEVRETWEFKPAEFFIIEERLEKCVCKVCQEGVVTAAGSSKPIEGGRPGPGLLAQIVTSKFRDGCPLYRQTQIYRRSGIELSPSTLGDWVAASADMLEPLWKLARHKTLRCALLSLDDTGMPVLDRNHPNGIKRGHIWTYLGDTSRHGFCDYTASWEAEGPCAVLEEFQGECVQGDGYAGINAFFHKPNAPKRAGCMDHARRKFVHALEAGHASAAPVLALMQKVYALERQARQEGLAADALLRLRQTKSKPLMDELQGVIGRLHPATVPKSALGKATTYCINQWDTLCVFLDNACVPLSNAHVERHQRRTALGRKNYLFAGSDAGARRLAIVQTFVVLCELNEVPLFEYLRDVLDKLPDWPVRHLEQLLPAPWWAEQQRQHSRAEQPPARAAA